DLVDLLTGYFYVNVHTDAQPDGEVRGQVGGAALLAATLAGAHEVPPVETDALGRVVAALEADARTFSLRAHVTGLPQVQAAHIHRAPAGQNGGVIFDLLADGGMLNSATPLTYTTQFTLGQALEMVAGNYYVNAHTTAFAGGEVRGQLMRLTPPSHLHAGLIGGEEVPAVTTDAAGIARLRVHPVLGQLAYRIDVTDIDNVEMAHIHRAERGSNGPVFVNFDLQPGELTSAAPVAGVKTLSGADWVDILSGNAYVNVHTQANAGGEIRGQVTTATPFSTTLSGAAEVPPVTTMASGLAVIALRGDTAALDYRVTVATIDGVSAAHIHTGVAGVNGDVVRDLNGATLTPTTPIAGSVDADNSLIFDLLRGRNYVNVHTAENPGGEIRGQLAQAVVPTEYAVALTPGAEIAPASAAQTDPSGEAILALDPVAGVLLYTLRVMNLDEIVAAHIHRGAVTENGPVVYGLYEGETAFDAENPIAGAIQLGSRDLVDLLTEFFYINVHTTSQPSGAIRGQVTLDSQEEMMPNLFVPQLDRGDE
ncbi:MAG: CHRD domain-containing protein, partial [Litorilinea sp.]